ncbi:acyltransferase [Anabaena sp. UHCC 0253]|uniref:acyltransferase family protein n=1 Tax=Anabaena sp. UHCC 0253 TaxID=2590019 RepID=UPI0014458778|nr:acyltransferase [Anabaena sp. UHCC 0253]MTJ54240.1 acyltransferase [Anabaena sp. UHCC 0253]
MKNMNRMLEVDAIRGIAALGIVLFHYASSYKWADSHFYNNFTYLEQCVQIFFIISGFVILISIKRINRSLDFIVGRFSRLYPVYLISVITTVLITNILRMAEPRTEKIYDILCNFFLLQDFIGGKSVNIVYWTLTLEICFYIIMLIIYKLKAVKYIDFICGCWIVIILIDVAKGNLAGNANHILNYSLEHYQINSFNFIYPSLISTFNFPPLSLSAINIIGFFKDFIKINFILMQGRAVFFIAGIMLYQIKIMGFSGYRFLIIGLCIVAKAFDYAGDAHFYVFILFTIFMIIIYLAIADKLKILAIKPFIFLGSISYSLYLIHIQVGWLLKSSFDVLPSEIAVILKAAIAVVIASILTFTVEMPAMKLIKIYYKKTLEDKPAN